MGVTVGSSSFLVAFPIEHCEQAASPGRVGLALAGAAQGWPRRQELDCEKLQWRILTTTLPPPFFSFPLHKPPSAWCVRAIRRRTTRRAGPPIAAPFTLPVADSLLSTVPPPPTRRLARAARPTHLGLVDPPPPLFSDPTDQPIQRVRPARVTSLRPPWPLLLSSLTTRTVRLQERRQGPA
jgi:hypothetical protein